MSWITVSIKSFLWVTAFTNKRKEVISTVSGGKKEKKNLKGDKHKALKQTKKFPHKLTPSLPKRHSIWKEKRCNTQKQSYLTKRVDFALSRVVRFTFSYWALYQAKSFYLHVFILKKVIVPFCSALTWPHPEQCGVLSTTV